MADTLTTPEALVARESRFKQFYALTKPRVVQLIVFCAVIGMLLAVPGLPDWKLVLAATVGIWLVAAAAAAFNCVVEQKIDAKMARTSWRPTAKGQLTNTQTLTFSALLGLAGSADFVGLGQSTDDVADLRHLRRLRPGLHPDSQTRHAAKHRDWRCFRRHATGAGLGRHARRGGAGSLDSLFDYFFVDTAAFLGFGALPRRGLPQVGAAHVAHHTRRGIHTGCMYFSTPWCFLPPPYCLLFPA
jgi:hypothetical protein